MRNHILVAALVLSTTTFSVTFAQNQRDPKPSVSSKPLALYMPGEFKGVKYRLTKPVSRQADATELPNIFFIVSDDHGWGDLPSNWDKTEVQLPTSEALAAKGVRFPNYHKHPPTNNRTYQ